MRVALENPRVARRIPYLHINHHLHINDDATQPTRQATGNRDRATGTGNRDRVARKRAAGL